MAAEVSRSEDRGIKNGSWSNLLPELLQLIAGKLTNICDFVRFRCACASWFSAVGAADLSPQLPWLLFPYDQESPSLSFFNPSDDRIYTLDRPDARWKLIFGSPHGWLVMIGAGEGNGGGFTVSLFNPITRSQIFFPSLPPALNSPFITKAILSSNPASASASSCPVLIAIWVYQELALCRLGDENWTVIHTGVSYLEGEIAFHGGEFYLGTCAVRRVSISVLGLESSKMIAINPLIVSDAISMLHLVESSSGDLILLVRCSSKKFEYFRLERGGELKWLRAGDGIGDSMLFLSKKQSMSVCRKEFSGQRENMGYFATDEFVSEVQFGTARTVTMRVFYIAPRYRFVRESNYWQASRRHWTDWKDLTGITWTIPSLSKISSVSRPKAI